MYNDYDSFYRPTQGNSSANAPESVSPVYSTGGAGPVNDMPPKKGGRKHRGLKITAIVLACVLADVYVSNRKPVEVNTVAVDGATLMSYAELYKTNVNSCVSINASETQNIFGQEATVMASSGSGFIITQDGYIATNYHVIDGSNHVSVTLYDGTTYEAEVVGGDEDYDIAVLKIDAENLTPVVIGDSSELNVGDQIAVIGNPLHGRWDCLHDQPPHQYRWHSLQYDSDHGSGQCRQLRWPYVQHVRRGGGYCVR